MVRASPLVLVLLALPALASAATFRAHLRRPRHGLQIRLSPITVAPRAAREGTVRHHTRSFQLGTLAIDVPPGQAGSASASWLAPFPMNVVWVSTHSHKHTQSVDVDLVRQGVVGPRELETLSYSEPTVKLYDTPLRLEAGDGFHWTCNYRNDTPTRLTFGVTSNDET